MGEPIDVPTLAADVATLALDVAKLAELISTSATSIPGSMRHRQAVGQLAELEARVREIAARWAVDG